MSRIGGWSSTLKRRASRGPSAVLSQGLSSISNLLVAVSVARVVSPSEYGSWALGYTVYAVSLHVTRSVASTPLMLSGDENGPPSRDDVSGSVAVGAATGVVVGVGLLIAAAVSGGQLAAAFATFAVAMPFLLANDVLRYVFFRFSRPSAAALMDALWLLVQIVGLVTLSSVHSVTLVTGTLSWALGTTLSIGAALGILRTGPSVRHGIRFFRAQRSVSTRLVVDSALTAGSTYLVPVIVAAIAGLAAAGHLRAGQTLMGGMNVLVMGLTPVLTLESRKAMSRLVAPMSILWRWTAVLALAAGLYGALVLAVPDAWGRQLVGRSWGGAEELLLPLVLLGLSRGPYTAGPILLKAMGRLNSLVKLRFYTMIPSLVCPTIGVVADGAAGAAWGLLAAALLTDLQCIQFIRRTRSASEHAPS